MADRFELEALQYVRNTGGGATRAIFEEDFEPVGHLIWKTLSANGWVTIDINGRIFLTMAGSDVLDTPEVA
jgi:hypothetical protein